MDMYGYTKDLTVILPDLSNIFILDNSPGAYRSNPGECLFVLLLVVSWAVVGDQTRCIRTYVHTVFQQ